MTSSPHSTDTATFPAPRGSCPLDPPPAYQNVDAEHRITRVSLSDGTRFWLITRHEDVRAVLSDRRFSAEYHRPGFPLVNSSRKALASGDPTFARIDGPEHVRQRRMLTGDFNVRRSNDLRPSIQKIVDGLIDKIEICQGPVDLVLDFALPLTSSVLCLVLGIPYRDHDFFESHSRKLLDINTDPQILGTAKRELAEYLMGLARSKEDDPADDVLSHLICRGDLTPAQVATMAFLLLGAGHETMSSTLALSILVLLRNPEQLALLRADARLIEGAVEELLRYTTVAHYGVPRVALEDVDVGGVTIRAGDGVRCMLSVANRDETVFPGAGALDLRRDARLHVAFGFGTHQCIAHDLARVQLRVALETLFRRLPDLRLSVPFDDIPFRTGTIAYGVEELPVTWRQEECP